MGTCTVLVVGKRAMWERISGLRKGRIGGSNMLESDGLDFTFYMSLAAVKASMSIVNY